MIARTIPYASRNRQGRPRRSGVAAVHQTFTFPSPMKGLDVQQNLAGGDPNTAVVLENLFPGEQGLELRAGYLLWQADLAAPCRTIMNYQPGAEAVSEKIFAACEDGNIYDITTAGQTTPLAVAHAVPGQTDPGNFSWINFNNEFGTYLLAVSAGGGYVIYDGTSWTTVAMGVGPGQIDGIDPEDFAYIWEWGNRLWFVQRFSLSAWYLPLNQITGAATEFPLGGLAPHGGRLYAGVNWTVDGGGGDSGSTTSMSDKIVFVTDQGDVIVYSGTDPDDAATFQINGRWYVGRVPVGGRAVRRYGQDVMFVSERGLVFLSELLRGQGFFQNAPLASRINPTLAKQVVVSLDRDYWEVLFLPHEQIIMVNYPPGDDGEDKQWVYLVNNQAFSLSKGMPMQTVSVIDGRTLFADYEGNIWWGFEGESDGATSEAAGEDIEGYLLSSYQPMGDGTRQKRALMAKVQLLGTIAPAVNFELLTSFAPGAPSAPNLVLNDEGLWDVAFWDGSMWAAGLQGFTSWRGATGVGYFVAISLKVKGLAGTNVLLWAAVTEAGGVLGV